MTHKFLVSGMEAGNVSVKQNTFCVGVPSPTLFIGMAETILHELGFGRMSAKVSPIFHNISVDVGKTRPEMKYEKNAYSNMDNPEDITAFVNFSFIMETPEDVNTSDISNIVKKLKIGGSPIFGNINTVEIGDNASGYAASKRGYVMVPYLNEANKGIFSFGEDETFKKVVDKLSTSIVRDEGGKVVGYSSENVGYRIPIAIGYRYIKNLKLTNNAFLRDKNKSHMFAEPGVGIAEFVSVRNTLLKTLEDDESMFNWVGDENKTVVNKTYL